MLKTSYFGNVCSNDERFKNCLQSYRSSTVSKYLSVRWDLSRILGQPSKAGSATGQIRFLRTSCIQRSKAPTVSLDKLCHWLNAFLIMKKFFLLANLILSWFSLCPLHFTMCLYDVLVCVCLELFSFN